MYRQDTAGSGPNNDWGGPFPGGGLFAIGDGSVRTISFSITSAVFANALNPSDGQVLGSNW